MITGNNQVDMGDYENIFNPNSDIVRGKMTIKTDLLLSPYFENAHGLANSLSISTYVKEYGCNWGICLSIRLSDAKRFLETMQKDASTFYQADKSVDEFEAHFNHIDADLIHRTILLVSRSHNEYICVILSNVGTEAIYDFISKYESFFQSRNLNEIGVEYFYHSAARGFSSNRIYVERERLQPIYPELYPDVNIDLLLKDYRASRESILILCGSPGVGKTTFIKYLLATGNFESIAYVKDPHVMNLGDMWSKLTYETYDLVIFDDLDAGLEPRHSTKDKEGSDFMSQLLSYSDGIFHANKTKIIITTNQHIGSIDGALVRAGRCFDFLQLNHLSREHALSVWTEILGLDEEKFNDIFKDDQIITQASLMSEAENRDSVRRRYIKGNQNDYTIEQKLANLGVKVTTSGQEAKGGVGFKK